MKLVNPTDDQLNACFAEKVAGWIDVRGITGHQYWWCGLKIMKGGPRFTRSADAVLPWLEKSGDWSALLGLYPYGAPKKHQHQGWFMCRGEDQETIAKDTSFPRAAVIALLRAHGVEVEFTT